MENIKSNDPKIIEERVMEWSIFSIISVTFIFLSAIIYILWPDIKGDLESSLIKWIFTFI